MLLMGGFWARRSAALYLAAWLMLGLLLAGLLAVAGGPGTGPTFGASALFALPLVLVYSALCGFSAYYLCRAFPLAGKPLAAIVGVFLASAVIAALLWCVAGVAWAGVLASLGSPEDAGWRPVTMAPTLVAAMFGAGVLLYGMTACAHYLALEFDRARRRDARELELKLLAQEAELRMLRTQIDPHFLFNSLNSISALTAIDAGAARDMTLQLAGFFRHTLGLEARRKVTLRDEVELVERFLAIERVRFGPRLAFEREVSDAAAACLLPPMILQPLIENAVKHGIGQLLDGGVVRLHAQRAGSQLKLRIENDAALDNHTAGGVARQGGVGLANVRQRLAAAYGLEASVHAVSVHAVNVHAVNASTTFRVDLVLPAHTEE